MKKLILASVFLLPVVVSADVSTRDVHKIMVSDTALYLTDVDNNQWVARMGCDLQVRDQDWVSVKYGSHNLSPGRQVKISVNGAHSRTCKIQSVVQVDHRLASTQ